MIHRNARLEIGIGKRVPVRPVQLAHRYAPQLPRILNQAGVAEVRDFSSSLLVLLACPHRVVRGKS